MDKFKLSGGWIALIVIGALVLFTALYVMGTYNSLVTLKTKVEGQWSQVDVQYQRRADLIPNLVNTIKGFTTQEQQIILGATELRTKWQSAQTRGEKIQAAQQMDTELDPGNPNGLLSRINVIVENYPQLKSNENFLALQVELANTGNKIAQEQRLYNEAVQEYNRKTRLFPSGIIARMFGFGETAYFQAKAGSENPPTVTF